MNSSPVNQEQSNGKSARSAAAAALLAAACAGMMSSGTASAAVVLSEPPDISNTLTGAPDLGNDVAGVSGTVNFGGSGPIDYSDYFKLSNLSPGQPFSIPYTISAVPGDGNVDLYVNIGLYPSSAAFSLANDSATLNSAAQTVKSGTFSVTVPADGILLGYVTYYEGAGKAAYTFGTVPEPGAAAAAAAAALASLARRRRPAR